MGNSDKSNCTELLPVPSPRLVRRGDIGNGVPDRDSALHLHPSKVSGTTTTPDPAADKFVMSCAACSRRFAASADQKMQVSRDG